MPSSYLVQWWNLNKREKKKKRTHNSAGVTSVRANLAVLIFSLRKKEACFLNSRKKGDEFSQLILLIMDMFDAREKKKEKNCKTDFLVLDLNQIIKPTN